jgi:hypothetical protein
MYLRKRRVLSQYYNADTVRKLVTQSYSLIYLIALHQLYKLYVLEWVIANEWMKDKSRFIWQDILEFCCTNSIQYFSESVNQSVS